MSFENMINYGSPGSGKMERLRKTLGMSIDEFQKFYNHQTGCYKELLKAEENFKKAKEAFLESCIYKNPRGP
jgi:uncharacterized protein YggL (DUF469 family)